MKKQLFTVDNVNDAKELVKLGFKVENCYVRNDYLKFQFEKSDSLVQNFIRIKQERLNKYNK